MLRVMDRVNIYIIPLIYALQIFTFVAELALVFGGEDCLEKEITEDGLNLHKYIIMDVSAISIFVGLLVLVFLLSKLQ